MQKTWRPPQRDATDVIIERILTPETIQPTAGFSQDTYQKLQREQVEFLKSEWMTVKADRDFINEKVKDIIGEGGGYLGLLES
jgi:hypothetical protein